MDILVNIARALNVSVEYLTGKEEGEIEFQEAKKEGRYIDGKKAYKANYKRYKSTAIKRGRARAQFINDL